MINNQNKDVKLTFSEVGKHFNRIGLWTNGANDWRTTVMSGRNIFDVQGCEPLKVRKREIRRIDHYDEREKL